ncbi:MAG: LamG-like jellyroll fold domain-containing protein [Saprospiraceae bacterium]
MIKYCLIALLMLISAVKGSSQTENTVSSYEKEMKYGSADDPTLPDWVRKMYAADPNVFEVEQLYNAYYQTHELVKNQHTQYYKRWKKNVAAFVNKDGFIRPPSKASYDRNFDDFLSNKADAAAPQRQRSAAAAANWTCIGPFDFDKDAAGRSHAPGAAHVYTVERAPSNGNILYCGTATAGVWKTVDKGLNWTCISKNLPFNYCNALEIHPFDPNIVWIGANNRIYKTIDGGNNWSTSGDAVFNTFSHSIDDLALQPGNPNVLFVASDKGFFRSSDGGNNFTRIIHSNASTASYFSEIEFKPNDPNTLYVIQSGVADKYTEFYKSTDGGLSFNLLNGWPVISSASATTYNYINRLGSNNSYASLSNDNLGTASNPNFTLEMRIRVPNSIADKAILANKNWSSGANNGWTLAARYTGELMFNVGSGSSRIELLSSGIWDNLWHHITVVYRASGTKEMYKDGVLVASSTSNITMTNTGLPMILGRDGSLNYGGFNLDVDDIRIWNTALPAATVSSNVATDITAAHPNYANLLHYYKCNSVGSNVLIDEKASNNGTIIGSMALLSTQNFSSATNLSGTDEQKRAEISVTAAKPNRVYALLAGAANGGSGLYGVYVSDDAGVSWTHKCCGSGPGGAAIATTVVGQTSPSTNANMLGYSETGSSEGGQYYYDLAMDADPGNGDKVHIAGINHWFSVDGGTTFNMPAKWSWPDDAEYVHADIHGIHIYGNEVWINSDGGLFMSQDSGKTNFNRRMYGIAGTDFWGFGMGHKDANVMLGGTYHNSHLMKNNNVYLNGWVSYTGSADGTRGFVNPGKPKLVYNDSRRDLLPNSRTISPTALTLSKLPNTDPESKITWDPRCYNCLYTGTGADLWYSEDDGVNWNLKYNFGSMNVADIEVAWDNPNVIWVSTVLGLYDPKVIWKSVDRGTTWTNVTPSNTALGYHEDMYFDITLGSNSQDVWMATTHRYGWYGENTHKVFYSSNGGASWTDWTTSLIANESVSTIIHQRGTNGGVYLGTRRSVFYRNKTMSNWVQFDTGLPAVMSCTRLFPWYKEGKLRNAGNQSVWETPLYEIEQPQAQPMVDKFTSTCTKDTFYFADYSAHYGNATFSWQFSPAPQYVSSSSAENPKVVFGSAGNYSVTLTVTDVNGTSSKSIPNMILLSASNECEADLVIGKAMSSTATGQYVQSTPINLNRNNGASTDSITIMAWILPNGIQSSYAGILSCNGVTVNLNFRDNNELGLHWNDSEWWWSSGLIVPPNQWSHVALVAAGTTLKLYLNGKEAIDNVNPVELNLSGKPWYLGIDRGNSSRTFKGMMDEACFYNRALSRDEIREKMHLIKAPITDNSLKGYFQFNESNNLVWNKVNAQSSSLTGGASRAISTAPAAIGASQRMSVSSAGLKTFATPNLSITFAGAGTYPNGDLVANRLDALPDSTLSNFNTFGSKYWIVNNHGSNSTFTGVVNEMKFSGLNIISPTAANYKLYKRSSNEHLNNWTFVDNADLVTTGANGTVTFNTGLTLNSFSQFAVFETPGVRLAAKAFLQGAFNGSNGVMDNNFGQGNLLPTAQPYTAIGYAQLGSGGENTTAAVLNPSNGNNSIIEWIFLELRSKTNPSIRLFTRSALLQKDGDIVDMDGSSPVSFKAAPADNYYIVVRHRNHLGFRTANTIALSTNPVTLNFTNNSIALNGVTPTTIISGTTYAMISGDANSDGSVDALDSINWENQNGLFDDYLNRADYNLDGSVDAIDSILWETNNGKFDEID